MSKKPRHSPPATTPPPPVPGPAVPGDKEPHKNPAMPFGSLAGIRNAALDAQADAHRTIHELEAWRDEIDATLAFLKAARHEP